MKEPRWIPFYVFKEARLEAGLDRWRAALTMGWPVWALWLLENLGCPRKWWEYWYERMEKRANEQSNQKG